MKLSAAKTALKKVKKNFKSRTKAIKHVFTITACLFLVGGFFYSLFYIFAAKNSLAMFADDLSKNEAQVDYINNILSPKCSAQNTTNKTVTFGENFCQEFKLNATLKEPNIQTLAFGELCKQEEPKIDEQIAQKLKIEIEPILEKTPMKEMIEPISKQDRTVAAFLVGIAKKESAMGTHAPHKSGKDCYNYWGYKGAENPTMGGYSCFSSPEHAVTVVGKRLEKLVNKNINTPSKMVVWKCGSSCNGHSPESVSKWIQDVSLYFHKINNS